MSTFNYLDAISIYLRLVSPKMKVKIRNPENIWRYHSILHNHSPELLFRKHRSLHSNWKPESVYHSSSSTRQPFCFKQPSPPKGMPDPPSAWKGSPPSPLPRLLPRILGSNFPSNHRSDVGAHATSSGNALMIGTHPLVMCSIRIHYSAETVSNYTSICAIIYQMCKYPSPQGQGLHMNHSSLTSPSLAHFLTQGLQ